MSFPPPSLPRPFFLLHATGYSTSTNTTDALVLRARRSVVDEIRPEVTPTKDGALPVATSLAWSPDGSNLFAGYTDSQVRVFGVSSFSS